MVEHIWSILCRRSVIDRETNVISLFDVVEQLEAIIESVQPTAGVLISEQLDFVTLWQRVPQDQPARARSRLTLLRPSGEPVRSEEMELDLSAHTRLRSINRIHGLGITGAGTYVFRVELRNEGESNWSQITNIPLQLILHQSNPASPG